MTNQNSKSKDNQRRFNRWQYKFLKGCSKKGDEGIKRWNEWRKKHPNKDIFLEGANLRGAYLSGAYLNQGVLIEHMGDMVKLEGEVYLVKADLREARLKGAYFEHAHLESADLWRADVSGAQLYEARLQGATLVRATVDGGTSLWKSEVNRETKCEGVGLGLVSIQPETKQLLEYSVRWRNWHNWYEYKDWYKTEMKERRSREVRRLMCLVKAFWLISDYGLRTWRIIVTFFALAIAFAILYWLCPNCVMVNKVVGDIRGFWHALYFSIVTMTTLGFGDIAANPDSWQGQTLLMLQVILGYVLLGALVTRFAVLFTAGGPAGKFSKKNEATEATKKRTDSSLRSE